jgi:ADP-ribose pyrophosphatase
MEPYHAVELPDWVNVVGITEENNLILIEQYRHIVDATLWEIPAGHVNSGEPPEQAAKREFLEETGYSGGTWITLGRTFAAASRLTNESHSYLAFGVRKVADPVLEPTEDIHVIELPWADFVAHLRSGHSKFREASQMATLSLLQLYAGSSSHPFLKLLSI